VVTGVKAETRDLPDVDKVDDVNDPFDVDDVLSDLGGNPFVDVVEFDCFELID
jgi:hypothetical protein